MARKTPAMFRSDLIKLQKQAENLAMQAHDRGSEKAAKAYFAIAHEIGGCAKDLKTVLGRISGRVKPPKKKRFARARKALGLNPKRKTTRKAATKRRPSLTRI